MEREVILYRCLGEKDRILIGQLCLSRFLSDRVMTYTAVNLVENPNCPSSSNGNEQFSRFDSYFNLPQAEAAECTNTCLKNTSTIGTLSGKGISILAKRQPY